MLSSGPELWQMMLARYTHICKAWCGIERYFVATALTSVEPAQATEFETGQGSPSFCSISLDIGHDVLLKSVSRLGAVILLGVVLFGH